MSGEKTVAKAKPPTISQRQAMRSAHKPMSGWLILHIETMEPKNPTCAKLSPKLTLSRGNSGANIVA